MPSTQLCYCHPTQLKQDSFLSGKTAAYVYLKHCKGIENRGLLCNLPESYYSPGPILRASLYTAI